MLRATLVLVVLGAAILVSPPRAVAKEDHSVRVCGSSGCKVVSEPVAGAAIYWEAERYGAVSRDPFVSAYYAGAYYAVRLVDPDGGAFGKEYRLPLARIRETQASSDPGVAETLDRATSGIEPYGVAQEGQGLPWLWIAVGTAGTIVLGAAALCLTRRRLAF